jgi:catalase
VSVTSEEAIDTVNGVFGRHPGFRALHAKGTLCKGTFTAAPEAASLTRAGHMQGEPVPATVRFSNGSGNPHHSDAAPDVRGLAIKMYLPDGSRTDIVAVTSPRFPTRTPEGFVELLRAQAAGPGAAIKFPRFLAGHPEALRGLPANVPTLMPPASYALIYYYGLHAFKWVSGDGGGLYVRYVLVPEARAPRLKPWEARRKGRDYLQQDITERLGRGPVRFTLELQVAQPGDPVDDPSAPWPKNRRRVQAGTLEVTGLETERETGGDVLVFDPTRVTDGIELSGDPVLLFRKSAYSASVARRMPEIESESRRTSG